MLLNKRIETRLSEIERDRFKAACALDGKKVADKLRELILKYIKRRLGVDSNE